MKQLHASFMRDLKNIEFENLYFKIIEFMDKKQVDDPNVQIAFAQVKPHVNNFEALRQRQQNEHSILNKTLTSTRTDYLISLRLRVKSYLRSNRPHERVAAKHIHFVLKRYDKRLYVANILTQSQFVHELVVTMRESENFRKAFTILDLKDLMDDIETLTEEIMDNYGKRVWENSESQEQRKGVRKAAYKDMKILIDTINFMYILNQNNEEKRAIAEYLNGYINNIFNKYRTLMRSRLTKRRNRKALAAAAKELVRTQQKPQKMLPVGISQELKTSRIAEVPLRAKGIMSAAGAPPVPMNSPLTDATLAPESVVNDIDPNSNNSAINNEREEKKRDDNGKDNCHLLI